MRYARLSCCTMSYGLQMSVASYADVARPRPAKMHLLQSAKCQGAAQNMANNFIYIITLVITQLFLAKELCCYAVLIHFMKELYLSAGAANDWT